MFGQEIQTQKAHTGTSRLLEAVRFPTRAAPREVMYKNHRAVPGDFCAPVNVHFTSVEIRELGNQYSTPLVGYVLSLLYLIFSHFFLTHRMDSMTYGGRDPPITNTCVWDALGRMRVKARVLPIRSSLLGGDEEWNTGSRQSWRGEAPSPGSQRRVVGDGPVSPDSNSFLEVTKISPCWVKNKNPPSIKK